MRRDGITRREALGALSAAAAAATLSPGTVLAERETDGLAARGKDQAVGVALVLWTHVARRSCAVGEGDRLQLGRAIERK